MTLRIIGAIFVIAGCGGVGFRIAANYRREERTLRQLSGIFDYMACELQYRLPSLPNLCRLTAREFGGVCGKVFLQLALEMEAQVQPDIVLCMESALEKSGNIPPITGEVLHLLGRSIGRFDLEGQLKGLEAVRTDCRRRLQSMEENKDIRLRCYQTLGLCAGAALAILLI